MKKETRCPHCNMPEKHRETTCSSCGTIYNNRDAQELCQVEYLLEAIDAWAERLPPDLIEKAKIQLAAHFGEDKGFTENHKLQYRVARYLFGQTFPNGPNLADGMIPIESMDEADAWINDWIDRTVSIGQLEFDSVNYHSLYYLCLTTLFDFSLDPLMKRKAWMMMQLLIADWAPEYLKGNWIGAHSREKYNQVK